jgi:hypothetical protein
MIFALQPGSRLGIIAITPDGRASRFTSLRHGNPGRHAFDTTGRVYAIRPDGTVVTLAVSGQPRGGNIGVESAGFVPPRFAADDAAYLADQYSKGNKHPGTNGILRLTGSQLVNAGVRPGDLLVATEGSAHTNVVRCATTCAVRSIAAGPAISHAEGTSCSPPDSSFHDPAAARPGTEALDRERRRHASQPDPQGARRDRLRLASRGNPTAAKRPPGRLATSLSARQGSSAQCCRSPAE